MADVRYQPCTGATAESGGWRVAVAGRALAALPAEVPVRTVETVWKRLGSGAGIGALLEALTGAFGTSLTAIPHFAVAVAEEDGMRVAVRGPLELVVEGAHETEAISGAGVTTWVERLLPGAHRLSIDFTGPLDDAAALPIADGVVAAAALVFTLGGGASEGADSPPQPRRIAEPVLPIEPELPAEAPDAPYRARAPNAPEASDAIDSVPEHLSAEGDTWLPLTSTSAPAASETVAPADADEDDELWGETVARPLQIAEPAVDPIIERVVDSGAPSSPSADEFGDHDGETIGVADLRAMREAERERFESTDQVPPRKPRQGRIRLSTGRSSRSIAPSSSVDGRARRGPAVRTCHT